MANQDVKVERLLNEGFSFSATGSFREGWELFRKEPVKFVLYTALIGAIVVVLSRLGYFGSLLINLVTPLLVGGMYHGLRAVDSSRGLDFNEFFRVFDYWLPLMIAGIIIAIGTAIGLMLIIVPGLWLMLSVMLVTPLILFRGYDFWPAITTSVKLSQKDIGSFIVLFIFIALINLAGSLVFGVGLLVSVPVSAGAIYSAYKTILGTEDEPYSSPNMFRV